MKKSLIHITVTAILLLFAPSVEAQERENIAITGATTQVYGNRLEISLVIEASGLNVSAAEEYVVDFVLESSREQITLPEVIYSGWQRYHFDQREEYLAADEKTAPYHHYKGVKKDEPYSLEYKLSLPYSEWMQGASLTCREYRRNCEKILVGSTQIIADVDPVKIPAPMVWNPDPALFRDMVCFLSPEKGSGKHRTATLKIVPDYPDNGTALSAASGGNADKLKEVDRFLRTIFENECTTLDSVRLTGYGSPDGPYQANAAITRTRTEDFRRYLAETYVPIGNIRTDFIAEDWTGIKEWIENENKEGLEKQSVLSVINDPESSPEEKERILRHIEHGRIWEQMKTQVFPGLRRIEIKADYTISDWTDEQLRELIFIRPELVGAEEMFRTARLYDPASSEYLQVFETAAAQYPELQATRANAAAALLEAGNPEKALVYLRETEESPEALVNLGVYYYIAGDLEKAEQCFIRAREAGIEKAAQNLQLLKRMREY